MYVHNGDEIVCYINHNETVSSRTRSKFMRRSNVPHHMDSIKEIRESKIRIRQSGAHIRNNLS